PAIAGSGGFGCRALPARRVRFVAEMRRLPVLALAMCVGCGTSLAQPTDYGSTLAGTGSAAAIQLTGVGDCYAAANVFTFDLSDGAVFVAMAIPFSVGNHEIGRGSEVLDTRTDVTVGTGTRSYSIDSGTVQVSYLDQSNGAVGTLTANMAEGAISGPWGCKFSA